MSVPKATTVVVSIGREEKGLGSLLAHDWSGFKADVLAAVENVGLEIVFSGTGTGVYDGMLEESFTVVAAIVGPWDKRSLILRLSELAKRFGQESIALTTGVTDFVKGS